MTPEELERLQACTTEIAQILYNNTPAEQIATLEGIEKAVRQQMMEYVSPKIALFLSQKSPEPTKDVSESSKVV
jgi:hypothetical protein